MALVNITSYFYFLHVVLLFHVNTNVIPSLLWFLGSRFFPSFWFHLLLFIITAALLPLLLLLLLFVFNKVKLAC